MTDLAEKQGFLAPGGLGGSRRTPGRSSPLRRFLRRLADRVRVGRVLALGLLAALIVVRVWDPPPVEFVRLKIFDFYQSTKPREPAQQPIVIVDIDEQSLAEIGQWPWPRTTIAKLTSQLMAYKAIAVAFDVVFAEPDRLSPGQVAERLPQLSEELKSELGALPDNDSILAETFARSRVVIGESGLPQETDLETRPIKPHSFGIIGPDPKPYMHHFDGLVRNLPELEAAATGHGAFTIIPESDGLVRRVPALISVGDEIIPTLSLELLRIATGQTTYAVKTDPAGIKSIVLGGVEIPTDPHGRIWVYFSPLDQSRYIPAKDVINGTAPPEALTGNVVFVGTSATGLLDIKTTPVNDAVPGVEVHAQLLEAMLTRTQLVRPNYAIGAEVLITAGISILIIIIVPLLGALWSLVLGGVVAATLVAGSWYLFLEERILIDVAFALATSFALHAFLVYENYFREEARRRQVRTAFQQYLSPALVEQLAQDPDRLVLGGETRGMTFLFCDVRGFTGISEQYRDDPQGLTALINRLLTPLTEAILERNGTIDKYMGDAIMAFWNAPIDDAEHGLNACNSALDMLKRLEVLNETMAAEAKERGEGFNPLRIGIGLNTGECTVGNLGSAQRFDYSVIGDSVNLASRLEGQSKNYGVHVIIGAQTAEIGKQSYALLELDLIAVKGRHEPEHIFALLGDKALREDATFEALAERNVAMLEAYRNRQWDRARALAQECRELDPGLELGTLYDLYEERIEQNQTDPPPPDWGGVFVAETK